VEASNVLEMEEGGSADVADVVLKEDSKVVDM